MTDEHDIPIVFLEGEAIYLRPIEMSDQKRCQRWINDRATRTTLAAYLPINEDAERGFIESAAKDNNTVHFAIVRRDGHQHIGNCSLMGIHWKDRKAEFGIMIGEVDQRGKGYGTETTRLTVQFAFETLNLNRVQLCVFTDNEAGIRAYEKVGFVREGIKRENTFVDGRYIDEVMYSLLAREYFASKDG